MNKILVAIERARVIIANRNLTPEKLAQAHKSMDMDLNEYARFQTLKSNAVGTKLTLDEAQTIYGFLGNSPETFNEQPLAVKWVLTEVFAELIKPPLKPFC